MEAHTGLCLTLNSLCCLPPPFSLAPAPAAPAHLLPPLSLHHPFPPSTALPLLTCFCPPASVPAAPTLLLPSLTCPPLSTHHPLSLPLLLALTHLPPPEYPPPPAPPRAAAPAHLLPNSAPRPCCSPAHLLLPPASVFAAPAHLLPPSPHHPFLPAPATVPHHHPAPTAAPAHLLPSSAGSSPLSGAPSAAHPPWP